MTRNCFQKRQPIRKVLFGICLGGSLWLVIHPVSVAAAETDLITAIRRVVRQTIPLAVHIEAKARKKTADPVSPAQKDLSPRQFSDAPMLTRESEGESVRLGTGVVFDSRGYVLTVSHLLNKSSEIQVLSATGRQYAGTLVAQDLETDLAVVEITPDEPFPQARFGDSDKVELGEWVVAIGHSHGLRQSVSKGIISARLQMDILGPWAGWDVFQTDAIIDPGNTGGPLLNLRGEVIGVNMLLFDRFGSAREFGFAIPSNLAMHIARELIAHGGVTWDWLGVEVEELSVQQSGVMERPGGAVVVHVVEGGPAHEAGIERGDIVTAWQGQTIPDANTLRNLLARRPVGRVVRLAVLRNGQIHEFTLRKQSLEPAMETRGGSMRARLGIDVRIPTPQERENYGLATQEGVMITWLSPRSPMADVDFEVGDMILEANGKPIDGVETLRRLIMRLRPHHRITMLGLDHRTGRTGYVQVTVP